MLKTLLALASQIEKNAKDQDFPEAELFKLKSLLTECQFSDDPKIQRLSEISDHLHPQMTLQHFLNFIVPIERLADLSLRDDQFLITAQDQKQKSSPATPLIFILDNIRSAFNVGSIFRMADGVGATEIYLCGYTPTPEQESLQKTSLGAHEFMKWTHFQKLENALDQARAEGYHIIALETATRAKNLYDIGLKGPTAFVVGNERFGLDRKTLLSVDEVRQIPLVGVKNSLNVANSLSIAAFEWNRQNHFN